MSTQYGDLTNTTFPNSLQTFKQWADLTSADATNYQNYIDAIEEQDTAAAKTALAALGTNKVITALDFNTICDTIVALQKFYSEQDQSSIINTLLNQLSFQGTWNQATAYKKFNLVNYTGAGFPALYLCLTDNTGLTPSTSSGVWAKISTSSITNTATTWKGNWTSGTTAYVGDMYAYNNVWWLCTTQTTSAPAEISSWTKVIDFSIYNPIVSSTVPSGQADGAIWFQQL